MATIKDITTMCKAGQIQEAYEAAKGDLTATPTSVWAQREVGWALYYMIKADTERSDFQSLLTHLDELKSLDLLMADGGNMIHTNVLRKLGDFVKHHLADKDTESASKLFQRLKDFHFAPSKGYSFLLQSFLKFDGWTEMADFLDWWNLDNLTQEDYTPFVTDRGQKLMTWAEKAFKAKANALLRLNDLGRIEEFLPKLDTLVTAHPEMTYLRYNYGKLLLALGSDKEETLKVLVPFARKMATEYWIWKSLSDAYADEPDMQLACLLRAVHCHTQEKFLGEVRTKLATLYAQRHQFDKARFHIDAVTRCYAANHWRLSYEINYLANQPWMKTATPNGKEELDYMSLTDGILYNETEEAIAIVTYADPNSRRVSMVYGYEKRMAQKLRIKVDTGVVLKINYIMDEAGHPKILHTGKATLPPDLKYAKVVNGTITKRPDKGFAFLKSDSLSCFVSPHVVQKYNVQDGEAVKSLIVYDYDKKKSTWNWVCVSIKR